MVQLLDEIRHLEQQFGADAREMMATFEQEALKLCDDTEDLILDMSRPAQPTEFNHLMRNLHTMKGIIAQSGLKSLSHLIHTIEDQMVRFKERPDTDLNEASASFVSFLDNLRRFVQLAQNPGDSEAIISIGSTLEVSTLWPSPIRSSKRSGSSIIPKRII